LLPVGHVFSLLPHLFIISEKPLEQFKHKTSSEGFDVSLTVRLSITLANEQLDAQILNTFITILYEGCPERIQPF
jgi:hypothetical protein